MAIGRLISKSLGSSRKFHALLHVGGKLGEFCQVLYPLIVANTDDFGRLPGDAFTIKNVVLPSSARREGDFETALVAMHDVGLLIRYAVDDVIYIEINDFRTHQPGLHQRGTSRFPDPCGNPREISAAAGNAVLREGKGREEKVREGKGSEGAANGARVDDRLFADSSVGGEPQTVADNRLVTDRAAPPRQRPAASTRSADALFAQFWTAYPKKHAKEAAQKAWDKRRPTSELLAVMLSALQRQKSTPDWQKDKGRYVPLPATWLNNARWTDEVDVDIADGGFSETTQQNVRNGEIALHLIEERYGTK